MYIYGYVVLYICIHFMCVYKYIYIYVYIHSNITVVVTSDLLSPWVSFLPSGSPIPVCPIHSSTLLRHNHDNNPMLSSTSRSLYVIYHLFTTKPCLGSLIDKFEAFLKRLTLGTTNDTVWHSLYYHEVYKSIHFIYTIYAYIQRNQNSSRMQHPIYPLPRSMISVPVRHNPSLPKYPVRPYFTTASRSISRPMGPLLLYIIIGNMFTTLPRICSLIEQDFMARFTLFTTMNTVG